jgi:hypothetical protein
MPRRSSSVAVAVPAAEFTLVIAERAYIKAERRGFAPGHELEDWLAAEREVNALLSTPLKSKRPAAPRKNGTATKAKPSNTK